MKIRPTIVLFVLLLLILPILVAPIKSSTSTNTLYAHAETTTLPGGNVYYLNKLSSSDGPATTLSQSAASTGRKLMGRWLYPLSGIVSIPASTWTVTYRAQRSASASSVVAHGDIDILIRKSDNTIRATIATNVANSPAITLTNTWQTLTGTYSWPSYTVVDQTDYLEVAYYIEVATSQSSKSVRLLVDDGTLSLADQTKIGNVMFSYPNQAPVASFTFSPSDPLILETVTFDASASSDSDGSIVSYAWNFGDGNITTVSNPIITHVYPTAGSTVNYTVTLTVTDNEGATGSLTKNVPVTNPSILHVSLPAGTYVGPNPDKWLEECWLLNISANSGTFTLRINNTSSSHTSYDTHLIIALNDAGYDNLVSLTVNSVSIPKAAFKNGEPKPYNLYTWPSGDVYPTRFNDTYVNIGTVPSKGYVDVTVSVTFSNAAGARMHFDAYGSAYPVPPSPNSKGKVTHNPISEDSTAQFTPLAVKQYYLTVSTDPLGVEPISGEGWYDEGTNVVLTASDYVPVSTGVRYKFSYWDVDGMSQGGGVNPITVTMNANHTATAHYVLQYYLTVSSLYGVTGGEGWYDSGATAYATVTPLTVPGPSGVQYIFTNWSGDASGTTSPSDPILMDGPKTANGNWKTQYYLSVSSPSNSPPYGSPTPTSGWFDAGTPITASVTSPWPGPSGTQYVCTGWTGTGSVISGSGTLVSFNILAPSSITWNWKTQFYLIVISPYGTTGGQGWYDSGATAYATVTPLTVSGPAGVQYVFTHWSGDASGTTSPSNPILMDGPKTATANWKTQYYLTVTSPFDSPTPTSGWFDAETFITASVTSPWPGPSGIRYVCTSWTGTGSAPPSGLGTSFVFVINGPSTIVWNWKTQYLLTVLTNPGGLNPQPTRNPSGEAEPPNSWWYDVTSVTLTAQSITGYTFNYWDVDGGSQGAGVNPISVTMNAPHTATAHYNVIPPQYYLTVTSAYDSPTPTSGLFAAESSITASVTSPWPISPSGTRYVCTGWTGTGSVPSSGTTTSVTFTITQDSSITWNWKTQYYLTLATNPSGVAVPSGAGWHNSSTYASISTPEFVDIVLGSSRYKFNGWTTPDMAEITNLSALSTTVHMDKAKTVTANYVVQYYFTVSSPSHSPPCGSPIPPPPGEWFDAGTSITASVTSPWPGPTGTRYVCTGWTGTGSVPPSGTETSVTFALNEPSSITWNWKTQYLLTVLTSPSGLSPQPTRNPAGEAGPLNGYWYDASVSVTLTAQSVTGYTFTNWDVDGGSQGVGVNPISVSMNAPHVATAHYWIPPHPVGGYSVSLIPPAETAPVIGYAMILAIFSAVMALIRRKRK